MPRSKEITNKRKIDQKFNKWESLSTNQKNIENWYQNKDANLPTGLI